MPIEMLNCDCMDYMQGIDTPFIDLTLTSPPYNLGEKHHTGNNRFSAYNEFIDDMPEAEYQSSQIRLLNEIYRLTNDKGSFIYNHKNRIRSGVQISPYEWILKSKWVVKQEIVWFNGSQNFDKCRFYPMTERIYWLSKTAETDFVNTINQHDLIKDNAEGTNKEHKRTFPIKLAERFIMCFPNCKNVFDPYLGSATTAIASFNQGKYFKGTEISKKTYDAGVKRFKEQTMQSKLF